MLSLFSVPGIHCNACEMLIRDVSSEFPSITTVGVDLTKKEVTVDHDDRFDFDAWARALTELDAKYRPVPKQ